MTSRWKYLSSFLIEQIEEPGDSQISPGLRVEYVSGKLVLNTGKVNYAFGSLDTAFRSAFERLEMQNRDYSRTLLLGLGPGNVSTILNEYGKPFHLTGVDLDPEVVRLGRKYFGLTDSEQLEIHIADAAGFVSQAKGPFDLIVVDLFVHEKVPAAAETPEFLTHLDRLLAPGGMLVYNRLIFRGDLADETHEFLALMQEILPGTRALKVKVPSNLMLIYEKST
ncbi:MAG: methyltransferase domain-containing protein [Bacteroidia bacterium]|nr:methyltransferase domain-containing protein [Bacteroidia bacterium]